MDGAPARAQPDLSGRLNAFSHAALKKIAHTLGAKPGEDTRAAYLRAVASVIGTPQHRELLERRLTPAQWELLNLLPARFGPFRLRVLALAGAPQGEIGEAALRDPLDLLASGCLLLAEGMVLPQPLGIDKNAVIMTGLNAAFEIVPAVADWAREHHQAKPWPILEGPQGAVAGSALAEFQRAVYIILAEAERKPLRLTQAGQPYKADLRNLAAALSGQNSRKTRGAAEPLPPLLSFALTVLGGAGLLVEVDGELRPAEEAAQFFDLPLEEQVRLLVQGWYECAFQEFLLIPTLQFGWAYTSEDTLWFKNGAGLAGLRWIGVAIARRCAAAAIAEGVAEAPEGWYPIAEVARSVFNQYPEMLFPRIDDYAFYGHSYVRPPNARRAYTAVSRKVSPSLKPKEAAATRTLYLDSDWMEVEGAFVREIVATAMRWLGLTEVAPEGPSPEHFRLTDLGRHLLLGAPLPAAIEPARTSRRAVVQPDYEVIVLDVAHGLDLLAQFDALAERRTLDRAATYRLTQAALARGLDRGWTGARVLAALESANGGPLPQNVRYSLEEWIRLYESLRVRQAVCLLEADSATQLDRWLADAGLAKLLGDRLGPTIVQVPAQNLDALLRRSKVLGSGRVVDYAVMPAGSVRLRDPDLIKLQAERSEPYLRYRIAAFADPVRQTDKASVYRITADSVRRAAEAGWRQPQIRDFLSATAGGGLPPDLAVRLCGWSGVAPPLRAEALVAVALPRTPVAWETLRHIPAIGRLLRALPTPELALVAPADLDRLRAELEERGLALATASLAEKQLGPQEAQWSGAGGVPLLFVHDRDALDDPLSGDAGEDDMHGLMSELDLIEQLARNIRPRRRGR